MKRYEVRKSWSTIFGMWGWVIWDTQRGRAVSNWKATAEAWRVAATTMNEAGGDPDYSPAYQDEYQRLWHKAAAEVEELKKELLEAQRGHDDHSGGGMSDQWKKFPPLATARYIPSEQDLRREQALVVRSAISALRLSRLQDEDVLVAVARLENWLASEDRLVF